ncbi:MAG TPA: hypothetical protein GX721_04950 [Firmicutes bacterium]|nr:hypothetical protein [Bacillota bacterium]
MQSASGKQGRGAAWAAPSANLILVLFAAIAICSGLSLLPSQPASAQSHAKAYTEPYFEYVGPTYSIGLSLDPVSIDYLAIDPGAAGDHRDVLAYVGKPSSLWLGIGGWGTHMPAKPGHVEVLEEEDKLVLAITGIEFVGFLKTTLGEVAPVKADWVFTFYQDFFDMELVWRVSENVEGLQEAGWALNIDLPRYGDSEEAVRVNQDVQGYPKWIVWYGPELGVCAVYRGGSTNLTANRWYGNLPSSYVIVHTWWKPGGAEIDWGTYPGGIWRVGFFKGADQLDVPEGLYETFNRTD